MKPSEVSFVINFCLCFIFSIKLGQGNSWATLALSCWVLKVRLTVDQVINTNRLLRILLPEIPPTEHTMAAFYFTDETWSLSSVTCFLSTDAVFRSGCRAGSIYRV